MLELREYQSGAIKECFAALCEDGSPVLFYASVGSGKSLMIAEMLKHFEVLGKRALCITHNAELVANNSETFKRQGGNPGIFCAALKKKDHDKNIIYGSCQSILSGLKKNNPIKDVPFNILVIDESHMVNQEKWDSTYMRIIRHYAQLYPKMRIVGFTGTPFRFNGQKIVGDEKFYHKQVANITMRDLVHKGFLVPVVYEELAQYIDFSILKTPKNGWFKGTELEAAIHKKPRLTAHIMHGLVNIIEKRLRQGAFIFASTVNHVHECMAALPPETSAYITSETTSKERAEIIDKARRGELKYLVNVNVFTVGIDIPRFDTICFVRPTESLVLLVQMIGRGMRLFPGKKDCLVIDAAQNLDRHKDWDDPIIMDAIKSTTKEEECIIPCFKCETLNPTTARRCIGLTATGRCDYYFDFKECPLCDTPNDITARHCRECKLELIDPNAKLDLSGYKKGTVTSMSIYPKIQNTSGEYSFTICYRVKEEASILRENFYLKTKKGLNIFYQQIIKTFFRDCHISYSELAALHDRNRVFCFNYLSGFSDAPEIKYPTYVYYKYTQNGSLKIGFRAFY